jgi:hypothetical protein
VLFREIWNSTRSPGALAKDPTITGDDPLSAS